MNMQLIRIGLIAFSVALTGTLVAASATTTTPTADVMPAATPPSEVYATECGSCHLAYPPGLLPAESWRRLLGGLEEHFGENAELDAATRSLLEGWLADNAAETGTSKRGRKILRSLNEEAPLRISRTPYIVRKHEDVRPSVFDRASVGSRANCVACHEGAERGDFDDDRVKIPK